LLVDRGGTVTARFRVVVTDQISPTIDIEREILAGIDADLEVAAGSRDDVLRIAADADALLNTYFSFDAEALGRLRRCRIVARYGIGVDNIDLDAARERGIVVTNVPDYCVEEVAAHAVAMVLSLLRRLPEGQAVLERGGWGVDELRPIKRLSQTTIGVVGLGRIGREVARLLGAFGARMVGYDPYVADLPGVEPMELDDLLATADAVSLHSPLLPETRGMIGAKQLAHMKPDAVLVNTSRGPLVVLDDLLDALRSGTIRGAGLDVYEHEPPDPARLHGVPGLLATPHSAFYSEAALTESQNKAATQVVKVLTGEAPDYQVN
jgi:D-3-phosphoglycerate dehydrogenase / 2-oxoglutarate reductase